MGKIEMVKQEKIYSPKKDEKNPFWKCSGDKSKIPKSLKKLFDDNTEISEEDIKNHYNVYVYKVLPFPPKKENKSEISG